jgi:hypothetical protein
MRISNPKYKILGVFSFAFVLVLLSLYACSYISPYSQFAYQQATSLKVEALALMDKATEPYENHKKEVEELQTKIEKAYEYVKGQPKNEFSARQWEILKDPERNLLGGFLKRWKKDSTLSNVFIKEAKGLVADAFDTISGLESGKIKKGEV